MIDVREEKSASETCGEIQFRSPVKKSEIEKSFFDELKYTTCYLVHHAMSYHALHTLHTIDYKPCHCFKSNLDVETTPIFC